MRLEPGHPDQAGLLTQLAEDNAAGVRLSPESRTASADPLAVWKKAGELGLPVSCQGDLEKFSDPEFRRLLDHCPDTAVVIEHLGGVSRAKPPYENFSAMLAVADRPNVYIKVPGLGEIVPRPARLGPHFHFDNVPPLLEMTLEAFGARRMMWGSDFPPVARREGYRNALHGITSHPAFADRNNLEQVMGLTAARVWGFPDPPASSPACD